MAVKYIITESEIGAGTRGASLGFRALEVAGWNEKSAVLSKHPRTYVEVYNEDLYEDVANSNAKRMDSINRVLANVADEVVKTVPSAFPIMLSGDHSIAAGTIAGLKSAHPNKRLGVVWIDAHADLHSPFTTPSGNVHGMPLGSALGLDNLANQVNELSETELILWETMKSLSGQSPNVLPHDTIFFGVRDTEAPEDDLMAKEGIKNYRVEEVRYRGMETCLQEAIAQLADCDMIYISFDVDSMDCDLISHGTGTPVSKGFDDTEIKEIIAAFIATNKVAAVEFVEINPTLDEKENKMAETAFDILTHILPAIEQQAK